MLIGINDIGKDIPEAVMADNIRKIIVRVQKESPTTILYVHSILPVNPTIQNFPQHYDKNEHVLKTNTLLRKLADSHNVVYVNIPPLLADKDGLLKKDHTKDGLHLLPAGYQRWAAYLKSLGAF